MTEDEYILGTSLGAARAALAALISAAPPLDGKGKAEYEKAQMWASRTVMKLEMRARLDNE